MSNVVRYRKLSFLGFPKYRVGTDGSFWRWRKHGGWIQRKVNNQGGVTLCRTINGVKEKKCHRLGNLVLRAFVGEPPPGTECCHDPDWNPTNNKLTNLRWATHKENMNDRRKHKRNTSKITQEEANYIRKIHKTGKFTLQNLGDAFGITPPTVHALLTNKTWFESK